MRRDNLHTYIYVQCTYAYIDNTLTKDSKHIHRQHIEYKFDIKMSTAKFAAEFFKTKKKRSQFPFGK